MSNRTDKDDIGVDALDALFKLAAACCVGHIRWAEGTYGHREAMIALRQARGVLIKSRYRTQAWEMGDMRPRGLPAPESEAGL